MDYGSKNSSQCDQAQFHQCLLRQNNLNNVPEYGHCHDGASEWKKKEMQKPKGVDVVIDKSPSPGILNGLYSKPNEFFSPKPLTKMKTNCTDCTCQTWSADSI
jgi:hypothetical protein